MRVGVKVATVGVVGLLMACPVGFAVGSQQGDSSTSAQSAEALESPQGEVYAYVPPVPVSDELISMCNEKLAEREDEACSLLLQIAEKEKEGVLAPGYYTKSEFEAKLGTVLP